MPKSELGERIKAAMAGRVSVAAMAKACQISPEGVYGWFRTGRIAKKHLPVVARLTGIPLDLLLGGGDFVEVQPTRGKEIIEVELPRDAIELARSWLVLPENERNDFRRKIETAALRYRDHIPDARMKDWGNSTTTAGKKGKGTQ
jgi:hypothetical protein